MQQVEEGETERGDDCSHVSDNGYDTLFSVDDNDFDDVPDAWAEHLERSGRPLRHCAAPPPPPGFAHPSSFDVLAEEEEGEEETDDEHDDTLPDECGICDQASSMLDLPGRARGSARPLTSSAKPGCTLCHQRGVYSDCALDGAEMGTAGKVDCSLAAAVAAPGGQDIRKSS